MSQHELGVVSFGVPKTEKVHALWLWQISQHCCRVRLAPAVGVRPALTARQQRQYQQLWQQHHDLGFLREHLVATFTPPGAARAGAACAEQ